MLRIREEQSIKSMTRHFPKVAKTSLPSPSVIIDQNQSPLSMTPPSKFLTHFTILRPGILHLVSVAFCLISSKFRNPLLSTLSNPSISSPSPNLLVCPLHLQLVPLFSNQTQTKLCPCSTLFSLYDREPWMCSTKKR